MPTKGAHRNTQAAARRAASNQHAFGTTTPHDSSSFRTTSGFTSQHHQTPLFGGDSSSNDDLLYTNRNSLGASSTSSSAHSNFHVPYNHPNPHNRDAASLLHVESSLSSIPSMEYHSSANDSDSDEHFELQLIAYRLIYVLQGTFFGLLGPSLQYFSRLAQSTALLNSPVSSFGPIFAAHGGAALLVSFVSELVLNAAIELSVLKYLMIGLLLCSAAWYACIVPVAAASGNLGVSIYFIAKGVWSALLNIALNRCVLWIAGEKIERGRSLVTSLNFAYSVGTVCGPALALLLNACGVDLRFAFYGLAVGTFIPIGILALTRPPRPQFGRDEHQTLLGFEDPTRRVPTVPSPIVGGVFLHVKHYGNSANENPDTYDPQTNLIILMVTLFATVIFGIQLGLGAFLFDFMRHVLHVVVSEPALSDAELYVYSCWLLVLFNAALALSYAFFSLFMFHALNLFSIFYLSVACAISAFGLLITGNAPAMTQSSIEGQTTNSIATFAVCLVILGSALAPLFTLSIHCLTRVINEALIRRVSSLIVFGCGMGEIFIPVLMGFFMSGQSGQLYGSVAVSYMTLILTLALVGVSTTLLLMVKHKLQEHHEVMKGTKAYAVASGVAKSSPSTMGATVTLLPARGWHTSKKKKMKSSGGSGGESNRL